MKPDPSPRPSGREAATGAVAETVCAVVLAERWTGVFEVAHFCQVVGPTDPASVESGLETTRGEKTQLRRLVSEKNGQLF
jgi:hypothetical protein